LSATEQTAADPRARVVGRSTTVGCGNRSRDRLLQVPSLSLSVCMCGGIQIRWKGLERHDSCERWENLS